MVWYLIRGLVREAGHWGTFVDQLRKKFPEDSFEAIDLPGNGIQNGMTSPLSMADYANYLHKNTSDCKEKKGIIAISLGGMAALEWCRLYPGEIHKLILINISLKGISPIHHRLQISAWGTFIQILLKRSKKSREKAILELVSNFEENREAALKNWTDIQNKRPVSTKNAFRQLWAASKYKFEKPEVMPITMLLASEQDRLASVTCSQSISQSLNLPLKIHPTAGHDLPLDAPNWVISEICNFINPDL